MALNDYMILSGDKLGTLVNSVKVAAADGWLPLGAPVYVPDKVMQAMVKGDVAGGGGGGGGGEVTAADITDATETGRNVLTAEDADAARTAIGAGTPYTLPAAGAALGGVKIGAAVADATDAEDVVAQVNALLASLRASGAIAS